MDKVKIREFIAKLPLDQIDVSKANVRITEQNAGLEELKGNIERIGLIQPIIVLEKQNKRYEVLVGQRRCLALNAAHEKTIPAIIIHNIDELSKRIISLSENEQRRPIPYSDAIEACNALFKAYPGKPNDKIKNIARDLSLPISFVTKYLAYELVPKQVREMVEERKLTPNQAYKITTALWPNEEKIIKVAEYRSQLTTPEWKRALTISQDNPKLTPDEIIDAAKKAPDFINFGIVLEKKQAEKLIRLAKDRKMTPEDLIEDAITTLLEGYSK